MTMRKGLAISAVRDWRARPRRLARTDPTCRWGASRAIAGARVRSLLVRSPDAVVLRRDPKVRATADFLKPIATEPPRLCERVDVNTGSRGLAEQISGARDPGIGE